MAEKELPEWTTEMDEEILKFLKIDITLNPTVIANSIGRSRGAVNRRLNALEAGGLVEKIARGQYRITDEAKEMVEGGWKLIEISEEERKQAAKEDYERHKRIEERTGLSEREYLNEVEEEYQRLKSENPDSGESLLSMAFEIVDDRYRDDEE